MIGCALMLSMVEALVFSLPLAFASLIPSTKGYPLGEQPRVSRQLQLLHGMEPL
jgi:hypothetical protein